MQKRRPRTQRRRRRKSEKRACSDTIEESSSADEVDARRKRARYSKESQPFCLTHIQLGTSLHLHITTVITHGRCSNDVWYHERASVHFTVARSLWLKSGVSHELCQSSLVLAPQNNFAHGGYGGVRLGEARNLGPAAHDRDRAAEERNARQRRIIEAGDSVLGSQDSLVRRVHNLQLGDTPEALTAPQTLGDLLRQPSAFRGASDHGLMLRMVQKHGGQQLIQESVAQRRNLDRVATSAEVILHSETSLVAPTRLRPVFSVTQSGRGGVIPATSAKGILLPEISSLVIPFRTVDNPDTRMQRPMARPPFSNIFATPSTTARPHPRPRSHRTRQAVTPQWLSLAATAWAESLKGAITGHQSWAVLCRYRCRLLLDEVPKRH